jgi:hypothetical protein
VYIFWNEIIGNSKISTLINNFNEENAKVILYSLLEIDFELIFKCFIIILELWFDDGNILVKFTIFEFILVIKIKKYKRIIALI